MTEAVRAMWLDRDDIQARINRARQFGLRYCCYCGCTEANACPGGCAWSAVKIQDVPDLCTSCADFIFRMYA